MLLSERFTTLPPKLRRLCGKVDIPSDGGAALAMFVMATGKKLYGVSDGSAKRGVGTHGWRLCRFMGDELALQGSGFVDGVTTTPFRAETQGQLAILIASTVLAQQWRFTMLDILSICDNKAVLKRLARTHRERRLADNKESDSDLYEVYRDWARSAPVKCTYKWVKGHQDRDAAMVDLPVEAQVNCEADTLAGQVYTSPDIPRRDQEIPVFSQEGYSLYTASGKATAGIKKVLLAQSGKSELEAFLEGKHSLSEGKRAGVNWEGLGSTLRAHPPPQRAIYVKYQQGWLPTNSFLHRQGRVPSALCPLCGTEEETTEHLHCCGNPKAVEERRVQLDACFKSLREAGTAPEIVNCWEQQLYKMFCLPPPALRDLSASRHCAAMDKAISVARKHQAILSWQGFLQGRHSVEWVKVQRLHVKLRREPPRKGLPWELRSVRLISALVPDVWRRRNEWVHGATVTEAARLRRERVHALVKGVYLRNPKLLPRFQSVRAVRLEERLQCPVEVLHVWLKQVERQESVTVAVQLKASMKAGSLRRFLVRRELHDHPRGRSQEAHAVFDRGK